MTPSLRHWPCILLAAIFTMTASPSSMAADAKASQSSLNDGYSLFYDFCSQESHLSLLLWVKPASPAIVDYAKRISALASNDMRILEKLGVSDSAIRLDKVSLPSFEIDVRKSMADDRARDLIFQSSRAGFGQAVAMSQSEATNYGLHVAKVLAETEPNSARALAMRHMYDAWLALHAEAYRLNR